MHVLEEECMGHLTNFSTKIGSTKMGKHVDAKFENVHYYLAGNEYADTKFENVHYYKDPNDSHTDKNSANFLRKKSTTQISASTQ